MPAGHRVLLAVAASAAVALGACSSSSSSTDTAAIASIPGSTVATAGSGPTPVLGAGTTVAGGTSDDTAAAAEPPDVSLIPEAVQALEAKLGGPQQYFEINATSKLVNLFVALNNGAYAQNWLYVDGALTSKDPQPASGHTFAASALTFDPSKVLSKVGTDLVGSTLDLFLVEGGVGGVVRYTVVVTSSEGGQLLVVVDGEGKVIEVDPN